MKKQSLEKQFEEKFRNYTLQPNATVWQTLETELAKNRVTPHKKLPIWWAAAASGALVLSVYTGYQYYNNIEKGATIVTNTNGSKASNKNEPTQELNNGIESTRVTTPTVSQNSKIKVTPEVLEVKNKPTELPMQQVMPNVPKNEVVIKNNESTNDIKKQSPNASTVPKTVLAEVKTLPTPPPQTINTLPNSNTDIATSLPNTNTSQPNTITYEPTAKQPIFSAWRELNEKSSQDSTTSERLLQLAEKKAKHLVKRVDIAGIWSDFKTLRGR